MHLAGGECGRPGSQRKVVHVDKQAENREEPQAPPDDEGRLRATLRCIPCGYNLRGLALDGVCPECGTPVRQSLLRDDLRLADPVWLRKIQRGLLLLMLAIGAVVGTVLAFMLVARLLITVTADVIGDALVLMMMVLIYLAAPVIGVCGLILSTTPEPPGAVQAEDVPGRRFTRWATLGVVVAAGLVFGLSRSESVPPLVVEHAGPVAMFLPLVPLSGLLRVLGGLLGRTKESKLAQKAKQSSSGMLGFVVLLVAASVVCVAVPRIGKDAHGIVLGLGVLIGLVCLASALTQLWRVRRVLAAILEDAEDNVQSWRAGAAIAKSTRA